MIETYKIVHGLYDIHYKDSNTRSHPFTVKKKEMLLIFVFQIYGTICLKMQLMLLKMVWIDCVG